VRKNPCGKSKFRGEQSDSLLHRAEAILSASVLRGLDTEDGWLPMMAKDSFHLANNECLREYGKPLEYIGKALGLHKRKRISDAEPSSRSNKRFGKQY
jgi:hypothetical protein